MFSMVMDSSLSTIPAAVGSLGSFGTQLGVGWSDKDQAIFKARDMIRDAWKAEDYDGIGQGIALGLSQIVKYESPILVEVEPVAG